MLNLGPIDPQMRTQAGASPADAILEQFRIAQGELQADASKLPSWMPILSQLGPSLLVDCAHAIELAKELVKNWTREFMFAGDPQAEDKSTAISEYLGNHANFKSHARPVMIPDLQSVGAKVINLNTQPAFQAAVDELYSCLDILLGNSAVYKVFENSAGDALIRQSGLMQAQFIQVPPGQPSGGPQLPQPAAPRRR